MSGIVRANALQLPLRDESVDLVVTSPPYFAQRSYKDGGEHYDGQVGGEEHPEQFLEALWSVMEECWRVLRPTGNVFVNLGDKRSGSGAPGTTSGLGKHASRSLLTGGGNPRPLEGDGRGLRRCPRCGREQNTGWIQCGDCGANTRVVRPERVQGDRSGMTTWDRLEDNGGLSRTTRAYRDAAFGRPKSRQALPERFVIGVEDGWADPCVRDHVHLGRHRALLESEECRGLGWIYRQVLVWDKPNGMPESARDRTRDSWEPWFHLTKNGNYYAALDELRQPYDGDRAISRRVAAPREYDDRELFAFDGVGNPLGSLPTSVWRIPTEPLVVPDWLEVNHFAAFPTEWPRRLIIGFAPPAICLECGEGRFPVTDVELISLRPGDEPGRAKLNGDGVHGHDNRAGIHVQSTARIIGYACACTPRTNHRGTRDGDWREHRVESDDHLNAFDTGSGNNVPRRPGGFGTKIPPPETPMIEYHLEGWTPPPSRPAVVLDPFGGTGTTALVARALGRVGISLDLSSDYCRLARWRVYQSGHGAKVVARRNAELQGTLL